MNTAGVDAYLRRLGVEQPAWPTVDALRDRVRVWAERDDGAVHVLLLSLRRFDALNLAYGTAAGDFALAEVAARLTQFAAAELGGAWVAARAGGGSFVLAANEACSRERWQLFGEQLADVVAGPIARSGGTLRLSPRVALLRMLIDEGPDAMLDQLGQTIASAPQSRRVIMMSPSTSTSMRVRRKQSSASSGLQTTGSFSLKLVLRTTGMPVRASNVLMRS